MLVNGVGLLAYISLALHTLDNFAHVVVVGVLKFVLHIY